MTTNTIKKKYPSDDLVPVTCKVKKKIRKTFYSKCKDMGLTPTAAIRLFVLEINKRGDMPFSIKKK